MFLNGLMTLAAPILTLSAFFLQVFKCLSNLEGMQYPRPQCWHLNLLACVCIQWTCRVSLFLEGNVFPQSWQMNSPSLERSTCMFFMWIFNADVSPYFLWQILHSMNNGLPLSSVVLPSFLRWVRRWVSYPVRQPKPRPHFSQV